MKRILALVLALSLIFVLASCGKKLNGTYASDEVLGSGVTYEFKGSKVTITTKVLTFEKTFEGKYKIAKNDDGKLEITFTFEDKDAEKYSGSLSFEKVDKDTIKIGGATYNKK